MGRRTIRSAVWHDAAMSRGIRALAPAIIATIALGLAAPAVADDPYDVPDHAVITLQGDGSGHGIGMSQYGAYRAAGFEGESYRQILRTYYPGTRHGRVGGTVEVLISADDDRDLRVGAVRGLRVRAGARAWRPRVARAREWRVVPQGRRSVISYRTARWHVWKRVRGDVELSAGRAGLTLRTPDGRVRYRGVLRTTRQGRARVTVNVLPMEQYVRGVVPAEMQAGWPQHALRAQAVAARTYAAFERADHRSRAYDLCDTAACQAYGGASAEAGATTRSTTATAKEVLTWRGDLAFAQYSASNGGWTVDGGRAYLVARNDPYEGERARGEGVSGDYYGWTVTVTSEELEELYNLEDLTRIRVAARDGSNRVSRLELTTVGGDAPDTYAVGVPRFVSTFGLSSALFRVADVS